jgi:ribosomal protein S18 acetylase RimI-like enzyme
MATGRENYPPDDLAVTAATAEVRGAALALALASLAPAERANVAGQGDQKHVGLFVAHRSTRLVGAVLGRIEDGRAARIWPPQTVAGEADAAGHLMVALVEFLRHRQVRIAHVLLPTDSGEDDQRMRQAGFQHATDALFLVSLAGSFPSQPPAGHFEFVSFKPELQPRLMSLLAATYTGSLDCPSLNGVRDLGDVLAGYRATGKFDPSRWLFVTRQGQDIGCLLLSDHPENDQWELVYMGLTPAARGKGWGLDIVRHAQWLAGQARRGRLVMTVDAANAPAIAVYAAAGFTAWDRRSVYLRVLDD